MTEPTLWRVKVAARHLCLSRHEPLRRRRFFSATPILTADMWRSQSGQPATDRDMTLMVPDVALPMSTLSKFIAFLSSHRLSNGTLSTLPALPRDDLDKFMKPYNDWAPPPFNTNNRMPRDSAVIRLTMCISDMDRTHGVDGLRSILLGRPYEPPQMDMMTPDLHQTKQHQWLGLPPLSSRRWAQKKLDAPENLDRALEHIVGGTLIYFNLPNTTRNMRRAYSGALEVLTKFDTALAAHHASISAPPPTARLADLWSDFFLTHLVSIGNRAHAWACSHLSTLADSLIARLEAAPTAPSADRASPQQDALLTQYENLANVIAYIDYTTLIPLTGFTTSLARFRPPPIVHWPAYTGSAPLVPGTFPADLETRAAVYHKRLAFLVRQTLTASNAANPPVRGEGAWAPAAVVAPLRLQREAYAQGRRELRGEAASCDEPMWVLALKEMLQRHSSWGFVGYRLWYAGISDTEWMVFVDRFERDVMLSLSAAGVEEEVRARAKVRWVDGRECGIAEGDVDAARRHYETVVREEGQGGGMALAPGAFLVAGRDEVEAYLSRREGEGEGWTELLDAADVAPFVTLVDAKKPRAGAGEGTGQQFDGQVRVAGSVLLDTVWPSLPHLKVEDLWKMASLHPMWVYVGGVTQREVEGFARFREVVMGMMVKEADEWERSGRLKKPEGEE
ncbi:hypothetical protein B0T18DRAFT_394882 [Schizothecium vesticola]|uniref:Uncharacterized protein n=1 Tax=Schizothecium vesticola TaxID=314040 RepID=A0AA40BQR2_9PEZI|nr:hypothetical protein B0T18DRAFT_394882 [Schizothecium vesticola]